MFAVCRLRSFPVDSRASAVTPKCNQARLSRRVSDIHTVFHTRTLPNFDNISLSFLSSVWITSANCLLLSTQLVCATHANSCEWCSFGKCDAFAVAVSFACSHPHTHLRTFADAWPPTGYTLARTLMTFTHPRTPHTERAIASCLWLLPTLERTCKVEQSGRNADTHSTITSQRSLTHFCSLQFVDTLLL